MEPLNSDKTNTQPTPTKTQEVGTVTADSKNLSVINWIGFIFLGFIPPLILMSTKADDEFVSTHAKEALNLSITLLIAYFVAFILTFVFIGVIVIVALLIYTLVVGILGAIAGSKGEYYKAPITLRLLK